MHTNDPSVSDKCSRRDSDDVICEFRGGGVVGRDSGGGGGWGWAMTFNWKAYRRLQGGSGNEAGF